MRTKAALPILVLLVLLLLGGVWAALRPAGTPLFPFLSSGSSSGSGPRVVAGKADDETAAKTACSPVDDRKPGEKSGVKASTEPGAKDPEDGGIGAQATKPPADKGSSNPDADAAKPKPPVKTPDPAPKDPAIDAKPKPRAVIRGVRHPPNQSLGNVKPKARKLKDENGKKALDSVTPEIKQDRRGLLGRYYAFQSNPIDELADPNKPALESRTPGLTRIDQQVAFPNKGAFSDLPFELANFFVTWEGFLVVPTDGDYWLFLGADLGGRVVLDSETVLLNDMFSDYIEVSTALTLTAGLHPLRIEYAEGRNGSVVADLCACNFMYVPTGKSQPIAVPPEMLLLPESLWSSAAPIIDRISPKEAEIGAEVVIFGHNFAGEGLDSKSPEALASCKVDINGQAAPVLDASPTMVKVRVPIGASSGKLTVRKGEIPSNSVDFKVSTQFGLFASWHNLPGWANYDFVEPGTREPDMTRLEREWQFASRNHLDLEFRNNPLACRWEGKLGVPTDPYADIPPTGEIPPTRLARFRCEGRLRVTLGAETKSSPPPTGESSGQTVLDFVVPYGEETYIPLVIDFTNDKGAASLTVVWAAAGSGDEAQVLINAPVNFGEQLPERLFFPPVAPPKPPKIISVTPMVAENAPPVQLPYDADTIKPSVREGQQFKLVVELYGSAEVRAQPLTLSIDGRKIEYTPDTELIESEKNVEGTERRRLICTLPTGCGEGKMAARLSIVQSDPFYIDVTNKGLIAYLYDFPNGGGYTQLPEFGPLACFKVRKDGWINFENANFLNLPFPAETFGIEYYGGIIIETEGDYVFTGRSDDGIRVWVNGQEACVDDNLHYQREKSGAPLHLVPGVYTFKAEFFENNVHEVFVLYFEAKDASGKVILPKQVIPKRQFTWDVHPPLPDKSSTGKLADGSAPQG
ncbi:hypothetical protein PLCT2_00224 [Planctomycetaceae bacterium]|nr:hypothetical protein PLCT2_00224 [Planctomycetaceae bacterium]